MQLSFVGVSIVLLVIWSIAYCLLRNRISTSKLYFALLAIMAAPALFFTKLPIMGLQPIIFEMTNILLFAFLMLLVIIPWLIFDKWQLRKPIFIFKEKYVKRMQYVFFITILLSCCAIVYFIPYVIISLVMGAEEMRLMLSNEYALPQNIYTTLAIGVATLSPIIILFVFISLLDPRLNKYTIWLLISSFTYCISNLAIGGRDSLIFTPLTYLVLFGVFRYSFSKKQMKKIKIVSKIVFLCFLLMMTIQSVDRFYKKNQLFDDMLYGTWGYIYQQPFVFNHILEQFNSFYGFKRRLLFMDNILDVPGKEYTPNSLSQIEFMFGTQFAEFYEISGYDSLIICTIIYLLIFGILIYQYRIRKKAFHLLVVFTIYVYFTISGLFYFRFGGSDSEFFMYMFIIFGVCMIPNILSYGYLKSTNNKIQYNNDNP